MPTESYPVCLFSFELKPGKIVYVPDEATKAFGRALKEKIEARWFPPPYYIHLGQRGHVRALDDHLDSAYFARMDIKSFFGSIEKNRITRHLTDVVDSYKEARAAAVMSTVPLKVPGEKTKYVLPFGFVQSPIVATLCLAHTKLGTAIRKLSTSFKITVYVDDILISTSGARESLQHAYDELLGAVTASKFVLNEEKLRAPAETTTVFNIDLATHQKRISEERLEEFRAALVQNAGNVRAVSGILGYVRSVNAEQAETLER